LKRPLLRGTTMRHTTTRHSSLSTPSSLYSHSNQNPSLIRLPHPEQNGRAISTRFRVLCPVWNLTRPLTRPLALLHPPALKLLHEHSSFGLAHHNHQSLLHLLSLFQPLRVPGSQLDHSTTSLNRPTVPASSLRLNR
jgi:hypothetical protein